jgi:hypothetical protein
MLRPENCWPAHDSGPGWLATPYLYDSCIHYFTPLGPGALQLGSKTPPTGNCRVINWKQEKQMRLDFLR